MYQPPVPYLNKNLNTWFKGIVNVRYTSKTVCFSVFCKFIKFTPQSNGDFYRKFCLAFFVYSKSCFVECSIFWPQYNQNSLKYQIWNFASWVDKMTQKRAIFFFEIAPDHCDQCYCQYHYITISGITDHINLWWPGLLPD